MLSLSNQYSKKILVTIHIGLIFLCLIKGFLFWENMSWENIADQAFWHQMGNNFLSQSIYAMLFILLTGSTIASILALITAMYFRGFATKIRYLIESLAGFLGIIPCLAWSIMVAYLLLPWSNSSLSNLLIGILVSFIAFYPMLLILFFQLFNKIEEELIDIGYGLGAKPIQIALLLILPKSIKQIVEIIVFTIIRISIEIIIVAFAIGIFQLSINWIIGLIGFIFLGIILIIIAQKSVN